MALWLFSVAYAAGCALVAYIVLRVAGSARFSRADHLRSTAAVFVVVLALVAWRNAGDRIEPDPYDNAQSAFQAS